MHKHTKIPKLEKKNSILIKFNQYFFVNKPLFNIKIIVNYNNNGIKSMKTIISINDSAIFFDSSLFFLFIYLKISKAALQAVTSFLIPAINFLIF